MQPTRIPSKVVLKFIGSIIAANLLLMALILALTTSPTVVFAQSETKATPKGEDGIRFDIYPHPSTRGALAYSLGDRWDYSDLTYYIHNCPRRLDCDTAAEALRAGFDEWARYSTLTFQEVSRPEEADIEMIFSTRGPEVGGIGGVLAYATFPRDGGDIVFDDSEPWSAFDGSPFDLFMVATHELGHALGLDHSSIRSALMYPVVNDLTTGLTEDDVAAIQALYGLPDTDKPPQPIPGGTSNDETVSGAVDDFNPYEFWEFDAFAGETLTITMTAVSGDLDPYLGILDANDNVLAEEGGSGDTVQITYTFNRDDTYTIVATREGVEEGFSSGEYTLNIAAADEAAPDVPPPVNSGEGVLIDIRSYSEVEMCEVYVSPSESDDWGSNLVSGTLTNGNYIDLQIAPGTYDVLAVTCAGVEIEEYNIAINADLAIEIYEDEINIYRYGA